MHTYMQLKVTVNSFISVLVIGCLKELVNMYMPPSILLYMCCILLIQVCVYFASPNTVHETPFFFAHKALL